MDNSFVNDIPDIYTDSSGDTSDDDSCKDLAPTKSVKHVKSTSDSHESKSPEKTVSLSVSSPTAAPQNTVGSSEVIPKPLELTKSGSKSPKSPKSTPKKADKESKLTEKDSKDAKKEAKKAVKKQEPKAKKAKSTSDNKDLLKNKLKELVKATEDSVDSSMVEPKETKELTKEFPKETKEVKEVSVTFNKEPKKKTKKPKSKDDKSNLTSPKSVSTETSVVPSETMSPNRSGESTPKKKRTKKAASAKEEGKSTEVDKMDLDKPDNINKTDEAEKSEKTENPEEVKTVKRKTKGDSEQKPKKPKTVKGHKSLEGVDKTEKTVSEPESGTDKTQKSKASKKVEKVKKAEESDKQGEKSTKPMSSPKKVQSDSKFETHKMTNDEVFNALSKLDDMPLGELKSRLMDLPSSDTDTDSDSDTDSSEGMDDLVKVSEKKLVAKTKNSDDDSDEDSDSDSDESDDGFIRPAKPSSKPVSDVNYNDLIDSSDDESDSDSSEDSVEPVKSVKPVQESLKLDKKNKVKFEKDAAKRSRETSQEEEDSTANLAMTESPGDKFINRERLESSFKTKAEIPQGCEIYCGNLPVNVSEDEIRELFEECGLITRINKLTNKGIAFITFSTPESAQKASEYNNSPYKGKLLNINITTNRPAKPAFGSKGDEGSKFGFKNKPNEVTVSNEICIRNLNFNSSEEGLRELFSECGQVTRCYLPKFQDSGKPMGVCFITFTTVEAAKRAVEYDQTEIDGRTVSIQYALPRNRFSNRGRAAKGRFTTGGSRVSTFNRSGGKFDGERRGGNSRFNQDNDFNKSTGANTVSEASNDSKPKSILFDDEDDDE